MVNGESCTIKPYTKSKKQAIASVPPIFLSHGDSIMKGYFLNFSGALDTSNPVALSISMKICKLSNRCKDLFKFC